MITLHHLENSRSHGIVWLLEELGVPYEIKQYQRDPKTKLAPAELLSIHPLGKAPVITDGTTTVAESGAIVEYLLQNYDDTGLLPAADSPAKLQYTYWLHYAEGTFMPLMVMSLVMNRIATAPMPFFAKPIARGIVSKVRQSYLDPNISRNLKFLEAALSKQDWFAGAQMTGADIQMLFSVLAAESRTDLADTYPALTNWLARVRALPAYQRALEKGGEVSLGG